MYLHPTNDNFILRTAVEYTSACGVDGKCHRYGKATMKTIFRQLTLPPFLVGKTFLKWKQDRVLECICKNQIVLTCLPLAR